ncbi:MAG: FGGY-family carbohydrate kinase [Lentisphaerae bacterium]|nr:FGGY-family carbohydrate kinase [Lentisphaerota bacterium]
MRSDICQSYKRIITIIWAPINKMPGILIGIDVGSTVLKAAAFDSVSGKSLAEAGNRLKLSVGRDGAREQSPTGLKRALIGVLFELRDKLGRRWRAVEGMGLAAQGGSTIIADKKTGQSLTPMMIWNDARARAYLPVVKEKIKSSFWRKYTLRDDPGHGLAKILWLKDTRPEIMKPDNIYVGAGEFCYFHLTGVWRQDACNALQIGCYNAVDQRLDQRLMDLVQMPISFVAPMRKGHEIHPMNSHMAQELGLSNNIPVAGPYMDHEAGYISASGVSRRPLQCSLGTAWVGNYLLPKTSKWHSPTQFPIPAIIGKGYLVIQALFTGNITWDWALRHLMNEDHNKALTKARLVFRRRLMPHEGLVALPWLNMGNPLNNRAIGGGTFFGVGPQTDKEELLRALALSMACEMARIFAEVKNRKKVDSVVLGGGASKGEFFRTLLAALFHPLPVYYLKEPDLSGTRGALSAFCAKAATAETKRAPKVSERTMSAIVEGYHEYLNLFDRLYGDISAGGNITFE